MEKFNMKSESDEMSKCPGSGGVSSLPKFTPGTKGAPKKITQIKFIDPEKIKQLGLEKTIAAAVHKLKVKTQSSFYQRTEGNRVGGIVGTAKRVLSQMSEDGKPTSIDVKSLIRRKLQAGKRSSLNLKSDAADTISAKLSRSLTDIPKPSVSKITHTPLAASKARKKPVANPDEHFKAKKTGRSKKVRAEKDIEVLTESELIAKKATEQIRLSKPRQYKNSSTSLKCIPSQPKDNISSLAKGGESTRDESPKKSCSKGDSSRIPSFLNLRHYLHYKRSQNEGSENSSDSTEVNKDKIEEQVGSVDEEKALEKQPAYKPSVAPISVLKVRKKGPLVKKPQETLVPGKIDVILTTDTEKVNEDEIKVHSELKIPSEESDDEPRTVVLKVINRDLKSGKIEMELIDPLIQPEKVQAVVTNSTADSAEAKTAEDPDETKEQIKDKDTDSDVDKQSTYSRRKSVENNLSKVVKAAQDPQRIYPSSLDEAIDSTDLFQKHMRTIYSSRPIKKLEDVVRKLSFSKPGNSQLVSNINNITALPSSNTSLFINPKSPKRKSSLEDEHLVDFDNSNVLKNLNKTSTCPLNFGGFFKKTISESEHDGGIDPKDHYAVVEETAVDFLLTVEKVDESLTEESLPSDCDSASLTQFDSLFDIKETSNSDTHLNELKIKGEDSFHNEFPFGLSHSNLDPLTVETSHSPYYELLGFENDEPVLVSFNHCDDYYNSTIKGNQIQTKPIIIENKILSDQEKIDTMAVLSQAGQQLSPSMKLTQNLGQDSSEDDKSVIIMGDDVPVEKEVLITMNSVDHSNHDMVEDYGFDGDSDVELLLMEESFENSNHTMVSKALQDQKEVEVFEVMSSAENSTNQVIVLSVEPNAEALGDAEGSIEFPFDSPIKKRSHADIGGITKELVANEQVGFEQEQNKVIIEIEESDNQTPVNILTPSPEDDKSSSTEAAGDERTSSKSAEHGEITENVNQSTLKAIACEISDRRISEPKETKVEEKRVRKTFKPVPKLRLALKNKKKVANILLKSAEGTKQNATGKDEEQQASCEDNCKLIDEEKPVKIGNQAFSDNQNIVQNNNKEGQEISYSSEENEKQVEDYVVLRAEEEQPVKSILRKETKANWQRDKRKNETHSFLDFKKEGNFTESRTVEDNLKTPPEENLKHNKDKKTIIVQPKGTKPQLAIQNDCASEEGEKQLIKTVKEWDDLQGCVQTPNQDSKTDCKKQIQDLLGLQESILQSEARSISGCGTCVKEQLKERTHNEPPGCNISKNQPPFLEHSLICDAHDQSSTRNKINIKDDRSKCESKRLDYFSTSEQNQGNISEDQLTCSLRSLKDAKLENQVSKEGNETSLNTGKVMYSDLVDSTKNDHEQIDADVRSPKRVNKEGEKFELRQYHRKNKNMNNVSVEQSQPDLLGLEDHVKSQISHSRNFIKTEDVVIMSPNMEPDEAKVSPKVTGERSDISSPVPNSIKKECIQEYGALCVIELGMQEAEKIPQIVSKSPNKKVDVVKAEELVNKIKAGRTKKESKISILEKWSHTEGTISPLDKPNNTLRTQKNEPIAKSSSPKMDETLKNEEKLKGEKSFEADFNKTIITTPNSIVKKKYNRKSKPASISKGYSIMKVAGESNEQETTKRILEEAAVDAYPEPSTSNGKHIKVEVDFATPKTSAEIPKKRGRKPRSSQNATIPDLSRVAETPLMPSNVPASAEVSRRGRIIKLTEKRRLSDIFNESKAKAGRKRKIATPTVVKKEPENEIQAETNEDTFITTNSSTNVEYEVVPAKKPKQENIINSDHSDSDSDFDVPLIKSILKAKSKKGNSISTPIPKSRGRKRKNTSTPKEKDAGLPKKPRGRKYDIEIKLHPKLLLVTKREDLHKEGTEPLKQVNLKDGEVRCGLCKEVTLEDKWKQHIETHYCIGWKEGEQPIDVEDYRVVLNAMNYYIRHNHISFVICRLCGLPMKSAMGVLYHLQFCKATLEEKKEMNYICVCGKVLQSKIWAPPHYKSCKGPPNLEAEPEEIEPRSRKRKAVLKAEKMIKEKIQEELEETPDDHMKKIVNKTVGCMTKWRFQLKKKGVAFCVGTNCNFASEELAEMHEHSKKCEKILWAGFSCVRCRFEHAEKDVVWTHVQQKHILKNTVDFEGSDSDAKIGSESSDSDFESGDEDNDRKRKRPKKEKRKRKPTTHTELYSDKWKKVYQLSASGDYLKETKDWTTSFRESNYSKKARFTYAIPEAKVLPYTTAHQYFAHNTESMKFSYNLEQLCNRRFSSSVKPEFWSTLGMFESKTTADEIITFIGGPVTNVSWVPVGDHETSKQYLALTYKKDLNEYAKYKDETPYKTCMLVYEIEYELGNLKNLTILYGVALDSGPVLDIQFLPSGGYAPALNRLGLVAVASKSTDPYIYSLPLKITENCDVKGFPIVALKHSAILRFEPDSSFDWTRQCTTLVWSKFKGHNVIVGGLVNGFVAVWDISEEDNLNQINKDDERCIIPTNFFHASERRVLAIDLHYDARGARWLILTTECKTVKVFDLREIIPYSLTMDDFLRTVVYNLVWPVQWENPILCYSDEMQRASTGIISFSSMGLMYHYRKAIKCASGAITGSFIDWQNAHVAGFLNGDLLGHRLGDWRHDVALQTDFTDKYLSYTDLIFLSGEKSHLGKMDPNLLIYFDKDYKEKYGLILSKFQPCGKKEKEISYARDVHFTLQQYVKINRVAGNPNAFGKELIAAGYENGLLRICLYNPIARLCTPD